MAALALLHGPSFPEEVAALVRSAWYAGHQVAPYTSTDATGAMPLYFYGLGTWQQLVGLGDITGRALSIGLGVVAGVLLFLICLRMTANSVAAAAAAFIFLGTPATAYAFATATPAAILAVLNLAGLWLVVAHLGRPRLWASFALGFVCVAAYFTRTDSIFAIVVLIALYIAGIGKSRALHAIVVIATIAILTTGLLLAFPMRLAQYAARLPILAPVLERAGLLAPNFALIDQGTTTPSPATLALTRARVIELLNAFALPHVGTILLALLLFALAGAGLRVLWIAPLFFLWLAGTHYFAAGRIGATDAPTFIGIGALAAGLAFALIGRAARAKGLPPAIAVITVAVAALALNMFAPMFATDAAYRNFPAPRMTEHMATAERDDTIAFARWIASYTVAPEALLPVSGVGRVSLPAVPFAVFLARNTMPAQSLDLSGTHRVINTRLAAAAREAVQAAVEDESLWTDDTMRRWIDRDYDVILYQDDRSVDLSALRNAIAARFDVAASTTYRGQEITLYKRKAAQ